MANEAEIDFEEDLKTFDKWDASEAEIEDDGLVRYINKENILAPKSRGRHSEKQFYKAEVQIAERLLNHLYVAGHRGKKHYITSGHNIGKSEKLWKLIKNTFEIIEEETGENPFQVLIDAIENSAPVEEVVTYQRGGVRARKAVLVSPQRRVDLALRLLAQGAYEKRLTNSENAEHVLADELIKASEGNEDIRAVREKQRREREAEGAR